jgi:hypothetical protein
MFERRELLKALAALPMVNVIGGGQKAEGTAAQIPPGNYLVFVDAATVDVSSLVNTPIPFENVQMQVMPLRLKDGQSMSDAVQIYRLDPESK